MLRKVKTETSLWQTDEKISEKQQTGLYITVNYIQCLRQKEQVK